MLLVIQLALIFKYKKDEDKNDMLSEKNQGDSLTATLLKTFWNTLELTQCDGIG